jgi:hypothetical protein
VVSTISLNIVEETTEKPKKEEAKKEQIDKKQSG